jgi:hypothetical protein
VPASSKDVLHVIPASGVLLEGERAELVFSFTPARSIAYTVAAMCVLRSIATGAHQSARLSMTGRGALKVDATAAGARRSSKPMGR